MVQKMEFYRNSEKDKNSEKDGNLQKTVSSISCFISAPLFGRAGCSTTQLKKRLSYISSKFLVPVKIDSCINDDFWKVLCLFAIVDDHLAFLIAVQTIQIFATTLLTFAKIIVIVSLFRWRKIFEGKIKR